MEITVSDVKSKQDLLRKRRAAETQLAMKINDAIRTGELELDDDGGGNVRGCGGRFVCNLFGLGRRRRRGHALALSDSAATAATSASASSSVDRSQSATSARIFGQRGKQHATAAIKLAQASESMQARVDQLSAKLTEAREKAMALKKAGKQTEALQALKRAKGIEKQFQSAMAAHEAIERQADLLAESELQKEVTAALHESVKTVKKKTKGLLNSTESAVDDSHEIKDLAEDVAQVLGGLQSTDAYDDDELLDELNAMIGVGEVEVEVGKKAAVRPAPTAVQATMEKPAPAYPSVPKPGALEAQALLSEAI